MIFASRIQLVGLLFLLSTASALRVSALEPIGTVNVRNFGAKGEGVTDDTVAIGAAMKAASIPISTPSPVGRYYQAGPTLVFPAGLYLISDEIPLSALAVRGEGQAAIQQKSRDRDILVSQYAWQLSIRNLTFPGGRTAINLYNPNIDTGRITIDHCRFYGTSDFAVKTDVVSTSVKINDCEFIPCKQSWYNNRCDQAVMRDCWITWRQKEATAPGTFAVKVIDMEKGEMRSLYAETFGGQHDYHAEKLMALFGGGLKYLEIRWYPRGWGMKSPKETDYFWAQPGQYVVMDFVRFEAD